MLVFSSEKTNSHLRFFTRNRNAMVCSPFLYFQFISTNWFFFTETQLILWVDDYFREAFDWGPRLHLKQLPQQRNQFSIWLPICCLSGNIKMRSQNVTENETCADGYSLILHKQLYKNVLENKNDWITVFWDLF